jgi:hypothetical protein
MSEELRSSDLGLNERSLNALQIEGITTVDELVAIEPGKLRHIPYLGDSSAIHIAQCLYRAAKRNSLLKLDPTQLDRIEKKLDTLIQFEDARRLSSYPATKRPPAPAYNPCIVCGSDHNGLPCPKQEVT